MRWLISKGFIDRRRIVIFGQSAGGGRVNLLLTRGHRYAAAILHDPIPSGHDAEALRAAALGLPVRWSRPQLTTRQRRAELKGFLFEGWRSRTPTLIMVGNPEHGAVDPLSAQTLYSMLLSRHVPTRFVQYLDDGHVPTTSAGVEDRFHQMQTWMDRYAPGDHPPS